MESLTYVTSRIIVTWDCIAKTKYKVLCVMCIGLASLEREWNGIFSAGTGQAAPPGDE